MLVQVYYIKLTKPPKGDPIVGGPVYKDNKSDELVGFMFDYHKKSKVAGICLFEPLELELDKILYSEDKVNYKEYVEKMFKNNPACKDDWDFDVTFKDEKEEAEDDMEDEDVDWEDDEDENESETDWNL